jgi:2-methylcitrate dehydratase PrpD
VDRAGATEAIANFVVGGAGPGVPDAAIDMAERAVVDTVGVTLAAGREETVKAISRSYRGRLPAGPCRVLTSPFRVFTPSELGASAKVPVL